MICDTPNLTKTNQTPQNNDISKKIHFGVNVPFVLDWRPDFYFGLAITTIP
jgi:hypothetical protein